jgi:hypothetical protein
MKMMVEGAAMVQTLCAYCGQTLQMVAGFCANCQAPVEIASQAKLVARALRDDHALGNASLPRLTTPTPAALPTMPPAPMPMLPTRMLLCGGIVALALVVVAISLRLGVNPIRALVVPAGGELTVSLTPGGDAVTTVAAGTSFTLQYAVTVDAASALVTLSITPQGQLTRSMTERWPRGITQRSQSLTAVTPGMWHITITRDSDTVRQMDLTITNNLSAMSNRSSNAYATDALMNPMSTRDHPLSCG